MIAENLKKFLTQLHGNVKLIAVSKTKPNEMILEAYSAGQRDFGENYVQEMISKQASLPNDIRWHFIGHLQSNKVKMIVPFVYLIHGVDSFKLLKEINKQSEKIGKRTNCLLQVHIAAEETKFGFDIEECASLLKSEAFNELKNVNVIGFMGMATHTENESQIKAEFLSLKNFRDDMYSFNENLRELSIGMSGDFYIALECGSTFLRIGSSIFGSRK
jgi:PLP dependent protein